MQPLLALLQVALAFRPAAGDEVRSTLALDWELRIVDVRFGRSGSVLDDAMRDFLTSFTVAGERTVVWRDTWLAVDAVDGEPTAYRRAWDELAGTDEIRWSGERSGTGS